jgi:2-oxoglutarate ferredoxin oxidoreductase subunit gamma
MNQASVDKFSELVKPGGVIVYNETLVQAPPAREDVSRVALPANRIALEMGNPQVANMVAMGGMARMIERISVESLKKGLARVLPTYRHDLIPLNEKAMLRGFEAVEVLEAVNG